MEKFLVTEIFRRPTPTKPDGADVRFVSAANTFKEASNIAEKHAHLIRLLGKNTIVEDIGGSQRPAVVFTYKDGTTSSGVDWRHLLCIRIERLSLYKNPKNPFFLQEMAWVDIEDGSLHRGEEQKDGPEGVTLKKEGLEDGDDATAKDNSDEFDAAGDGTVSVRSPIERISVATVK